MLRAARWVVEMYQRLEEQDQEVAFKFLHDTADDELAIDLVALHEGLEMLIPMVGVQAFRREVVAMVMTAQKEMVPT